VAIAVAIGTMGFIVLTVVYVSPHYTDRVQGKWVRFALITVVLIAFAISRYWKIRKSLGFWGIFLAFLAIHMFGVGYLWAIYNGLPTLVVGFVSGAELVCMALVIYWVLGVGPDARSHSAKSPWIPRF
jgi:hypothetical protein